jgi:ribosomal RNA-processing protein 36
MKKALKKKLALVEKYKELKESGKLEDFMTKRRKKMMLRDHTLFPRARNAA